MFLLDLVMSGGKATKLMELPCILIKTNQTIFRRFPQELSSQDTICFKYRIKTYGIKMMHLEFVEPTVATSQQSASRNLTLSLPSDSLASHRQGLKSMRIYSEMANSQRLLNY